MAILHPVQKIKESPKFRPKSGRRKNSRSECCADCCRVADEAHTCQLGKNPMGVGTDFTLGKPGKKEASSGEANTKKTHTCSRGDPAKAHIKVGEGGDSLPSSKSVHLPRTTHSDSKTQVPPGSQERRTLTDSPKPSPREPKAS